jgi:ATP-binding cassette, subfamily B, bacterial PglK
MIRSLLPLLNSREKFQLIYVALGVVITSFLEVLSIGIFLPLVAILMEGDLSFFGLTIENYLHSYDQSIMVVFVCTFVIGIFIFKNAYLYLYNYSISKYSRNIQQRISYDLFKTYLYEQNSVLNEKNIGTLMRNINAAGIVGLYLISFLMLVIEIVIILTVMIFLLKVNFVITSIVSLIFLSSILTLFSLTKKKLFQFNYLKEKYQSIVNQHTIQSFSLIKVIKIFNKEKLISKIFKNSNFEMLNNSFKSDVMLHVPKLLIETLVVSSLCIIIIYMIWSGSSSKDIIPLITIYAASAIRLMPSATRIISSLQRLKTFLPSLMIISAEYKAKQIIDEKVNSNNFIFSKLEFKNVDFGFDNKKLIFKDLNIKIKKGEVVGIFGDSGAGKSTFANLISGLIFPTKGEIIYNDNITNNLNKNLSPTIGYVPQQTTLFDDTIWNNITFFENKKDDQSIKKFEIAVKQSKLKDYINSLPEKEDMKIGEGLSKISGGQAQRIGIARALFIKSDFLIFDESTSSLDSENEKKIIDTIYSLKNLKTIIIISHKHELLHKCDKIYQIVSNGIHQKS